MDEQLKQRLLGATVIVALAVIIVPELVKQPTEEGAQFARTDIPPRPAQLTEPAAATIRLPSQQVSSASAGTTPSATGSQNPATASVPLGSDAQLELAMLTPPPVAEVAADTEAIAGVGNLSPLPGLAEQTDAVIAAADQADLPSESAEAESAMTEGIAEGIAEDIALAVTDADETVQNDSQIDATQATARATTPTADDAANMAQADAPKASVQAKPKATQSAQSSAAKKAKPVDIELPPIQLVSLSQSKTGKITPKWVVQAGSFTVANNANLLRDSLRAKQFSASLSEATVGGRIMYRVRVGPHSTRDESERTRQRLQREAGISGSVVPIYN